MEKKLPAKKVKASFPIKNIFIIVAVVVGLLSLLLLLAPGINYDANRYPADFNLAAMIFGNGKWAGMNYGLLSAFIIMIAAIIFGGLTIIHGSFGLVSVVLFLTSSILWFCTVPLYGNMAASLAAGPICLGIFNIVDMLLIAIGATYR